MSNFKGAGSVLDKTFLQQQERRARALARDLKRLSADEANKSFLQQQQRRARTLARDVKQSSAVEVNKLVQSVSCSVKSSWQLEVSTFGGAASEAIWVDCKQTAFN